MILSCYILYHTIYYILSINENLLNEKLYCKFIASAYIT